MIETKKLLDRIELLFPCKENIRFRRAMLDHDFESTRFIIELINEYKPWSLFLNNLIKKLRDYPQLGTGLSHSQVESKHWLMEELKKVVENNDESVTGLEKIKKSYDNTVVFIYGGWYGILAGMLFCHLSISKIRSFDMNPECRELARKLNIEQTKTWDFQAATLDVNDLEYHREDENIRWKTTVTYINDKDEESELEEAPDFIINTSAEHMFDKWFHNIPEQTLVLIQSNDYHELSDHINCVKSLDEMKEKYKLSTILYSGILEQSGMPIDGVPRMFNRFMLIGTK
jgi:hypothetical protein